MLERAIEIPNQSAISQQLTGLWPSTHRGSAPQHGATKDLKTLARLHAPRDPGSSARPQAWRYRSVRETRSPAGTVPLSGRRPARYLPARPPSRRPATAPRALRRERDYRLFDHIRIEHARSPSPLLVRSNSSLRRGGSAQQPAIFRVVNRRLGGNMMTIAAHRHSLGFYFLVRSGGAASWSESLHQARPVPATGRRIREVRKT